MNTKAIKTALAILLAASLAASIRAAEKPLPQIIKPTETKEAIKELKEKEEKPAAHYSKVLSDAALRKRKLDSIPYTYTYEARELEDLGAYYITAYCNCSKCCTYANQATASGVYPHFEEDPETPTTCAIDPSLHSFGDVFEVDGKTYIAEDTGSAVKGRHLDLFFEDHAEVAQFGSHYATVYAVSYETKERKGKKHYDFISYLHPGSRSNRHFLWAFTRALGE